MIQRTLQNLTREGRWIPWIFVGFFLVVFAVNGIMVTVALSTWTGLTTETHYRDGVEYNKRLDAAQRQAAMGWRVGIEADSPGRRMIRIAVDADAPDGGPLYADSVSVRFVRPTTEGYDSTHELHRDAEGRYVGTLAMPLAGVWDARVTVHRDGRRYQTSKRVFAED
jgi:nitrogen fixation protein FixH